MVFSLKNEVGGLVKALRLFQVKLTNHYADWTEKGYRGQVVCWYIPNGPWWKE